jgi:DNA-directed RNA polymerase specialized sigma24 family protein
MMILDYIGQIQIRAMNLARNKHDAEDLASNVVLQLLRKPPDEAKKPASYINVAIRGQWMHMNRTPAGKRGKYNYFYSPYMSIEDMPRQSDENPWELIQEASISYDLDYWIDEENACEV